MAKKIAKKDGVSYICEKCGNEMKGYFKILDVQGVGFVPFIAGIQSSTKLVEKMEMYIKLERKLARRKILRNLGMEIMIVAEVLK